MTRVLQQISNFTNYLAVHISKPPILMFLISRPWKFHSHKKQKYCNILTYFINVKRWFLGTCNVKCWQLSNISANIAVAIFRVTMYRLLSTSLWQPVHSLPEDGKCNVCQNTGQLPTFDEAYTWKTKFRTEHQPRTHRNNNPQTNLRRFHSCVIIQSATLSKMKNFETS
jgi:hypothetical protein